MHGVGVAGLNTIGVRECREYLELVAPHMATVIASVKYARTKGGCHLLKTLEGDGALAVQMKASGPMMVIEGDACAAAVKGNRSVHFGLTVATIDGRARAAREGAGE